MSEVSNNLSDTSFVVIRHASSGTSASVEPSSINFNGGQSGDNTQYHVSVGLSRESTVFELASRLSEIGASSPDLFQDLNNIASSSDGDDTFNSSHEIQELHSYLEKMLQSDFGLLTSNPQLFGCTKFSNNSDEWLRNYYLAVLDKDKYFFMRYAPDWIKKDENFGLMAVKKNPTDLNFLANSLKANWKIGLAAIWEDEEVLAYVDRSLRKNALFILAGGLLNPEVFTYLAKSIWQDFNQKPLPREPKIKSDYI